jgi:D-alanyl-D-alanine carboxypeptidase
MFRLLVLTAGILISMVSISQDINRPQLDAYFRTLGAENRVMGNVLISTGNKHVYEYQAGMGDLAAGVKLTDSSLFRVGSVSKTYTAVLILKAAEEKKLSLDQSADKYFPKLPHAHKITIRQLLNHHSGVSNFTNSDGFGEWASGPRTGDELLARISAGGSDFEPGSKGEYSNSNYVLLSMVLEQVYKKPYSDILKEKILLPLGLKNTGFGPGAMSGKVKVHSYGYETGWQLKTLTHLSVPSGAGAVITTTGDLASFITALFNGRIINAASLEAMKTETDGYGLGIFKQTIQGTTAYTHSGIIDGFYAFYYYFPGKDIVYTFLVNGRNYDLGKINETVFKAIFQQPFEIPSLNAYKVTDDQLQVYAGTYSSEQAPLVITISSKNNQLLAHPQGQQVYTMEAVSEHNFSHEATGVTLAFKPAAKQMILKQGQQTLLFTKKE